MKKKMSMRELKALAVMLFDFLILDVCLSYIFFNKRTDIIHFRTIAFCCKCMIFHIIHNKYILLLLWIFMLINNAILLQYKIYVWYFISISYHNDDSIGIYFHQTSHAQKINFWISSEFHFLIQSYYKSLFFSLDNNFHIFFSFMRFLEIINSILFLNNNNTVSFMLQLIIQVWNDEKLPNDWMVGVICPIQKKSCKMNCFNYCGTLLLSLVYKVLSKILISRLEPHAKAFLSEYQAGFTRQRSTPDQLFNIRQIVQKSCEMNVETHHFFIDFKAEQINQKVLWSIMAESQYRQKK